jgi:predicted cobalt transporter CbtA
MKKLIIGGLVGGILLFLWQTLSWTVLNLHAKEYQQAPAQDSVLNFLNS